MKKVTAAIIYNKDRDQILLARRAQSSPLSGYWEFPGGKVESEESLQECIERELLEELGVTSKAGEVIVTSEYKYDHGTFKLFGILTEIQQTDFHMTVHDKIEWVKLESILNYQLAPADIPIAKIIMER